MAAEPLQEFRVVDLSRYGPGRYCSMLLADFGADVITVETPRVEASLPSFLTDDTSPRYLAFNRGKRSIALNLRKIQGQEIFYRLISIADVLIEGFRPGVTKKNGIDYETLKKINNGLIYCSISGFGQDGPYQERSGHDINYVGIAGILDQTGYESGPPAMIGTMIADLLGGFCQATMSILLALLERKKSGEGQYIDISMLDGLIHALWLQGMDFLLTGRIPKRGDDTHTGLSAGYNIYETLDNKFLTVGCLEPWFWEKLCKVVGRLDYIPYQRAQHEKRQEVISSFRDIFKTKTRTEWLKILIHSDIPCGPINNLLETFSDPQVIHRKMVVESRHPTLGIIRELGVPMKLSRTPGSVKNPAPKYGGHTKEILEEIGYTQGDIDKFKVLKVIE